jgi:tRNA (guanosine-2'-O-)-methyltransferase
MFGFTESLNVSVSAGIILHTFRQKMLASKIDWHLDDHEKLQMIKLDWLRKAIKRSELIEEEFLRRINS